MGSAMSRGNPGRASLPSPTIGDGATSVAARPDHNVSSRDECVDSSTLPTLRRKRRGQSDTEEQHVQSQRPCLEDRSRSASSRWNRLLATLRTSERSRSSSGSTYSRETTPGSIESSRRMWDDRAIKALRRGRTRMMGRSATAPTGLSDVASSSARRSPRPSMSQRPSSLTHPPLPSYEARQSRNNTPSFLSLRPSILSNSRADQDASGQDTASVTSSAPSRTSTPSTGEYSPHLRPALSTRQLLPRRSGLSTDQRTQSTSSTRERNGRWERRSGVLRMQSRSATTRTVSQDSSNMSTATPDNTGTFEPREGENQSAMLSRILSVAAASTVASLIGGDATSAIHQARDIGSVEQPEQPQSRESTAGGDSALSYGNGSFEEFLRLLRNGDLDQALGRANERDSNGSALPGSDSDARVGDDGLGLGTGRLVFGGRESLNYFRMFRFDSHAVRRSPEEGSAAGSDTETRPDMIPVIIVGVRAMRPNNGGDSGDESLPEYEEDEEGGAAANGRRGEERRPGALRQDEIEASAHGRGDSDVGDSLLEPLLRLSSESMSAEPEHPTSHQANGGADGSVDVASFEDDIREQLLGRLSRDHEGLERPHLEVDSPEPVQDSNERPDRQQQQQQQQQQTRSWIIYVLGGNYPANHPVLTTPSLFTDSPTYEDMLALSAMMGVVKPPVATRENVDASGGLETLGPDHKDLGTRCLVCMEDMVEGDVTRRLQACGHLFHRECVDQWLVTGRNSCPLCRGVGVATGAASDPAA